MWSAKRAVVYLHSELNNALKAKFFVRSALTARFLEEELARDYADALVGSIKHERRAIDVEENFEEARKWLAKPLVEGNSAEELMEYLRK